MSASGSAASVTPCLTRPPRSSCATSRPRPATDARSPTTWKSRARTSKRASGCGSPGRWPTAIRRCSPSPNEIILDRKGNRHFSFGLGVHRCIGSNVARTVFKSMLTAVLDRMPDYQCDPEGTVHYETIGVIQGMRHLPATFTPGRRARRGSGRNPGEASADLRRAGAGPAHHRTQRSRRHRLTGPDDPQREAAAKIAKHIATSSAGDGSGMPINRWAIRALAGR